MTLKAPTIAAAVCLVLCLLPATPALEAAAWPHLRGPGFDGVGRADSVGSALVPAWRVPLGSGYSGIAVADGRAVTMFTEGDSDYVGAFDAGSGKELWRYRLDTVYRGHDGSHDGPLASPLVHGDTVYALGPRGQLVALDLGDGKPRWTRNMETDYGAKEPIFGFTTTPLVVDGVLVLLTGAGEGRAISGLDPATGERLWSVADGLIEYQTPIPMKLGGRDQVVTVAGKELLGFVPKDGKVLWRHRFADDEWVDSSTPAPAGADRFLVFVNGDAVVFEVAEKDDRLTASEVYRSKALGQTYALPVYRDGYLYGFRGQALSCVDAETGERVWRSRPPGGRGLILVGDQLIVFGAAGTLVVADASPEGYRERSRLEILGASGYTWPSFADDRVFVRNLEELAAAKLTPAPETKEPTQRPGVAPAGGLAALFERLENAADKDKTIAAFFEENPELPLLDGTTVQFLYHGEAEDLAIEGTIVRSGNPEAMARVPGTDLFYKSIEVEPATRWEYRFVRNFDERLPDPHNPRQVPSFWGSEMSEVVLPGYPEPSHLAEPKGESRGRTEKVAFTSQRLGAELELVVYLPPGYPENEYRYPLLVVFEGDRWLEKGLMANSLDNLIGQKIEPLIAVFIKTGEEWWLEAGGSSTGEYVDTVAEELVPFLEERYPLAPGPNNRAVMGRGGYAVTSALVALGHSDRFGKAALQSVHLGLGSSDTLLALLDQKPRPPVTIYLDWNRYEGGSIDSGVDLRADSERLAAALSGSGFELAGGEMLDSSGWSGWRARTDRILETFFPLD